MKLRKFWKHRTVPAPNGQLAPVGDDKTVLVPNDKIVPVSDEVDDDVPMPNIFDMDGRLIDPNSPEGMPKPLLEGQEGPESIFYVPSASTRRSPSASTRPSPSGLDLTIPNMLAQLSRQGVQPENFIMRTLGRSQDVESHDFKRQATKRNIPHFQMNYRVEDGQSPSCPYCKLILENAEGRKGFDLQELYEVAKSGCETCDVLQLAITYFARFVFLDFDRNRVWVKQSQNSPSMLLSETKMVEVHFEEHQDEVLTLSFKEVVQSARNPRISMGRIEDTSTDEAMTLIKGWLQECMESHDQCQIPDASVLPKRVLSISDGQVRLIETDGQVAPYLTLSHCWGRPPFTQMTSRNIDLLKQEIPWTWLSKSFQDAIIITHRLGFRYLWIDGLCILQNDKQDWEYHASKMSKIFSSSQLTIAVSRAGGGDKGCFSRHSDRILELQGKSLRKVKNPLLWQSYYLDGRDRDGIPKTFAAQLKTPHGLFKGRTPEEPLLRRAWVFQEQILSPRIIHYASGELYFECKSQIACECRGKSLRSLTTQWETRWRKAHEVLLEAQQPTSTDRERLRRSSRHFEAYRALIETYTELDITNDLDRLPALSGVTFGRQDLYLAGMWGSILLESLHWTAMPRGNMNMAHRPVQYRGPSWSWVSIEAPIRHVEVEFSKTIHSPKLLANIINASCSPEGLDPRGRVSSGYLQIQGPLVDVQVTEIGFRHRDMSAQSFSERSMAMLVTLRSIGQPTGSRTQEELALCTYAMLKNGDNEEHCYLDMPLALCRTNPAEVALGDTLTCLVISSRTALVLKACGEVPGIYTRVGIFLPKSESWSFWDRGSIVIV